MAKRRTKIKRNFVDKAIEYISPVQAAKRYRARAGMALIGGYVGASKTRRSLKEWKTYGHDADYDLYDLATLRNRSRDLVRNNPLATGAMKTKVSNVVGSGLKLQSRIDRKYLNLTEEQADEWEENTEREWSLFWDAKDTDIARTLTGNARTAQVYDQTLVNGDVFVLLPQKKRFGCPYDLKIQIIEADRVTNKDYANDSEKLSNGIEKDKYGAPTHYHIQKFHPGSQNYRKTEWQRIPAFSSLGLRNVIHLYNPSRPGQSRGVPDLAPVMEMIKQLGRYSEAELDAAVVSAFFTVFIESASGDVNLDLSDMSDETGSETTDDDYKLASGAIIGLSPGEKVHDSNPGRPNDSFDPFVMAMCRQIGVALGLPFELLVKHFTASYSAARAALLEAWKYFMMERSWLAENFNQEIFKVWMYEAVTLGRIVAPGFLVDPAVQKAYLGADWVGPAKGQIDELKEVKAAKMRKDEGFTTISQETKAMTGGDWEKNHPQSVKEHTARKEAGLIAQAEPEEEMEKIEEEK